ncbi:MAG: DUF4249 family protein [Ignavibacteria bacterium]|jgi:hypothetical protein|nr:DUF4249 family protein [Ignavibacteria bacterium]MCU7500841.1 DUF4249 family protein [Ignavibacteria bacterium]MCU7513444.1 DUF4249 family protein [Ignavibacteria bacterium]MCU7521705.1 DUF4249 family protein [Ignavibacteria bacterium]MCU7525388.1 DUF4249 family protein [Ignavibacteria bacterium]
MKKLYILMLIAAAAFFNMSCEETVSPKAAFKEQYVLTCIVNISADTVLAVISKTYDVNGFNPEVNKVDPALTGAEITITQGQTTYKLHEGERLRADTSRYTSHQQYYIAVGVKFVDGKDLKIAAKLPNGRILSAVTTPPDVPQIEFSYEFPNGVDPTINWYIAGDYYTARWYPVNSNHYTFPRLSIPYQKNKEGKITSLRKIIPISYVKQGDKLVPYYPGFTQADSCAFEYKSIVTSLHNLPEGDPNLTDYTLKYIDFELLEFDAPLTTYYSSTNGQMDNFSIRTEEMVYSNISGGLGIFGTYRKTTVRKKLDAYYITTRLGFNWDKSGM